MRDLEKEREELVKAVRAFESRLPESIRYALEKTRTQPAQAPTAFVRLIAQRGGTGSDVP